MENSASNLFGSNSLFSGKLAHYVIELIKYAPYKFFLDMMKNPPFAPNNIPLDRFLELMGLTTTNKNSLSSGGLGRSVSPGDKKVSLIIILSG